MDEHILAALLALNRSVAFLRTEPLHGALRMAVFTVPPLAVRPIRDHFEDGGPGQDQSRHSIGRELSAPHMVKKACTQDS